MIRPSVDWEQVERDYRAGIKTLRVIAAEHGITHGAINKRANKEKWARDLAPRIEAKTKELVSRAIARVVSTEESKTKKLADAVIVDANAEAQAGAILKHQSASSEAVELAHRLVSEVSEVSGNKEQLEAVVEELRAAGSDSALAGLVVKALNMHGRVATAEKAIKGLVAAVDLDRRVRGLDKDIGPTDPAEKLTREELEAVFRAMMDRARVIPGVAQLVG